MAVTSRSLSLLVPIHNENENIRPFYKDAVSILEALDGLGSWQMVFLNDGSTDASLATLRELKAADPRLKIITLSRNFGYQAALVAGLSLVESDLYAIMDVDGEDPPDLLRAFYQQIRDGADLAYGIRSLREESRLITFMRAGFYHINRYIADSPAVLWMGELSMMTRQVREAVLAAKTTYPFLRAEMAHVGFHRVGVPYRRLRRRQGQSHYNLFSMTRFAVAGFLSSSTFPLRLILYLAGAVGIFFPILCWWLHLTIHQTLWTAVIVQFYFLLVTVPMIALYLARAYKNGINRPLYVVDQNQTFLS